jgi:hypothetical protein
MFSRLSIWALDVTVDALNEDERDISCPSLHTLKISKTSYPWQALKDINNGFYVDVSANSPTVFSVTGAFYERCWLKGDVTIAVSLDGVMVPMNDPAFSEA